jgi:D-glycerate 3-kinase
MMNRDELRAVAERAFAAERIDAGRLSGTAGDRLLDSYAAITEAAVSAASARATGMTVFGLCGAQGSGKSTTARIVQDALRELFGLSVTTLSLDDLYLSRATRGALARTVHPLFATRGVPGTHDVGRGLSVIQTLEQAGATALTALPRFDKATDEPVDPSTEPQFTGCPNVLIFEGWCVGARAEEPSALLHPINALERDEDPDGRWRGYVNEQLAGPYQALFSRLDRLVMLRAPNFECVAGWRQEQEHKLLRRLRETGATKHPSRVMSDAEVARFVMYFERVTRHVLADMPTYADLVIELASNREVLSTRGRR